MNKFDLVFALFLESRPTVCFKLSWNHPRKNTTQFGYRLNDSIILDH